MKRIILLLGFLLIVGVVYGGSLTIDNFANGTCTNCSIVSGEISFNKSYQDCTQPFLCALDLNATPMDYSPMGWIGGFKGSPTYNTTYLYWSYDGIDDAINWTYASQIPYVNNSGYTESVWFIPLNLTTGSYTRDILGIGYDGRMSWGTDRIPTCNQRSTTGGDQSISMNNMSSTTDFYHYVVTYNITDHQLKGFMNGALVTNRSVATNANLNPARTVISGYSAADNNYYSKMKATNIIWVNVTYSEGEVSTLNGRGIWEKRINYSNNYALGVLSNIKNFTYCGEGFNNVAHNVTFYLYTDVAKSPILCQNTTSDYAFTCGYCSIPTTVGSTVYFDIIISSNNNTKDVVLKNIQLNYETINKLNVTVNKSKSINIINNLFYGVNTQGTVGTNWWNLYYNNGSLKGASNYTWHWVKFNESKIASLRGDIWLDYCLNSENKGDTDGYMDRHRFFVEAAYNNSKKIMYILDHMPVWLANVTPDCITDNASCMPNNYTRYELSIKYFLDNVTRDGNYTSAIESIEIYNEPYSTSFMANATYAERISQYIRIYNFTYTVIKKYYPTIKVGGPSGYLMTAPDGINLTDQFMANFTNMTDFVSVHTYYNDNVGINLMSDIFKMKNYSVKYGGNVTNFRLTEWNIDNKNTLANNSYLYESYIADAFARVLNYNANDSSLYLFRWSQNRNFSSTGYPDGNYRYAMLEEPNIEGGEGEFFASYNVSKWFGNNHPSGATIINTTFTGVGNISTIATNYKGNYTLTVINKENTTYNVTLYLKDFTGNYYITDMESGTNYTISSNSAEIGNINGFDVRYFEVMDAEYNTYFDSITLNYPTSNLQINNSLININFNFTAVDNNATFRCTLMLDGNINQTNTSVLNNTMTTWFNTFTEHGKHNYSVNCSDGEYYNTTSTYDFTLNDTVIPTVSGVGATSITINSAIINFASSENANVTLKYGKTTALASSTTNSTMQTTHNMTLSTLETGTRYYYNITVYDIHGNQQTYGVYNFSTVNDAFTGITLNYPTSGLQINNSLSNINFNFTATDDNSTFACTLNINGNINQTNTSVLNNTKTTFFNTFTEHGKYNYSVNCSDGLNYNTTSTYDFTLNDTLPTQVSLNYPTSNLQINNSLTNINFNFTTIDASPTSSCTLKIDGNINQTNTSVLNNTMTTFFASFPEHGKYNYSVNCTDYHANLNTSLTYDFTLNDTVAPTLSSLGTNNVTHSNIVLNWVSSENANSTVNYGLTTALGSVKTNSSYITTHNISFTGLTGNSRYYYNITTYDVHGISQNYGVYNFTTAATWCGDGIYQATNAESVTEVCDGSDLNSYTCSMASPGLVGGTLACYSSCTWDFSGCISPGPGGGGGGGAGPNYCGDGDIDERCMCGGVYRESGWCMGNVYYTSNPAYAEPEIDTTLLDQLISKIKNATASASPNFYANVDNGDNTNAIIVIIACVALLIGLLVINSRRRK